MTENVHKSKGGRERVRGRKKGEREREGGRRGEGERLHLCFLVYTSQKEQYFIEGDTKMR